MELKSLLNCASKSPSPGLIEWGHCEKMSQMKLDTLCLHLTRYEGWIVSHSPEFLF